MDQPIVFKPATFYASKLVIEKRDRKTSSSPSMSFSNGKEKFSSSGNSFFLFYIGFLNNGKKEGKGVLLFYNSRSKLYKGKYVGIWKRLVQI